MIDDGKNGHASPVDAMEHVQLYDIPFRALLPDTSGSYERDASSVIFGTLILPIDENNDTNRLLPPTITGIIADGNTKQVAVADVINDVPNTVVTLMVN